MSEIAVDLSPLFIIYEDGCVDRLVGNEIVPPSLDAPNSKVQSKDIVYSQDANLSSRLYLPKGTKPGQKLPLLVYFHGGGFVVENAFSPAFQNYLNPLAEEANVLVVSVDYRRAPEHLLPVAYDDSWVALKWIASHSTGNGPEEWLNSHADFGKVFLAGDSAGGNIAYNMAMRHGEEKLRGTDLLGIVLVHPFFWGKEPIGSESDESLRRMLGKKAGIDKLWQLISPNSDGCDDPSLNPEFEPNLARLGCSKVLVAVAERDLLRDRGRRFYETLEKSGWEGKVEILEAKGEDHAFHYINPNCDSAKAMQKKFVSFLNQAPEKRP